nr:hypothetical protein [Candidatus Sigynarchaeota archaeon]
MTTKRYHQARHRASALRKFGKIKANWFPRGKGKWECKKCLYLATSLKKVFEHACKEKLAVAPVENVKPEQVEEAGVE